MPFSHANGQGGNAFSSIRGDRVKEFYVSTQCEKKSVYVESVKLKFDDGKTTERFGGNHGRLQSFCVSTGDFIVKVEIRCGWGTDALRFTTNKGIESEWYGGTGGGVKIFRAGPGEELVGIQGRCGSLVDKLVPLFATGVSPERVVCKLEPIYELAKGTGFKQTETIKYKVGYNHNTYSESKVTKLASQASAKVKWGFGGAGGNANVNVETQNAFSSASCSTSKEYEYTKTMDIDARNHGVYLYRGIISIHLNNGEIVTLKGSSLVGSPTSLVAQEYTFH
mmetsp:Transcript_20315/g.25110  ORF Transcript_20315/g.25110 Transcript_20315/m.25110 type:complete len:280 (-) Transcript_20315:126-965(-)|eukprot:CAMPEP_0172496058 /NCGR_PEP_ID=MMETSP1066-20121228/81027_1 /TAXON_ID=671091 /ORGANISM="Coscinodiscus wailesii, Strain CCMP2513" /LENGTH=279 /DNA_ID=CAMNT_0013268145 /DNA_START=123 /DNA_END=962 /DNA_ORIENTATION=+